MRPGEDVGRRHLIRRADPLEERPEHPGIALDRPAGAGASLLLGEESDDSLHPGRDVIAQLSREQRVHGRSPEREWSPT
jgi:hypothetical protein